MFPSPPAPPPPAPPANHYGPWLPDLDPAERTARTRELRALAFAIIGHASPLTNALRACESGDDVALAAALGELDALPALQRRRLLSAYTLLAKR